MKKEILILLLTLAIGVGIGYLIKPQELTFSEKNLNKNFLDKLFANPKNKTIVLKYLNVLSNDPATPLDVSVAQRLVKGLYTNLGSKPQFINETINPSYVFNLKPIFDEGIKHLLSNPADSLQMRIFPALNDRTNTFTLLIGLEVNDKLIKTDNALFEYIGPCPRNCPEETSDLLSRAEWQDFYSKNLKRNLIFN